MRQLLLGVGRFAKSFPVGTAMLFQQTTAPLGWTKQATHDDKCLRVVTGTASSGGATAFSSVFGAGKTTGSTVLTTAHLPASGLSVPGLSIPSLGVTVANTGGGALEEITTVTTASDTKTLASKTVAGTTGTGTTGNMGTGGGHTHTESLDLQFVDVIIATKDAG